MKSLVAVYCEISIIYTFSFHSPRAVVNGNKLEKKKEKKPKSLSEMGYTNNAFLSDKLKTGNIRNCRH